VEDTRISEPNKAWLINGTFGVSDVEEPRVLFENMNRQIITSGKLYEKKWKGDISFTSLNSGLNVTLKIAQVFQTAVRITAFYGEDAIPFAGSKFLGHNARSTYGMIGMSYPVEGDAITCGFLPNGSLIANTDFFGYSLGNQSAHWRTLFDLPDGFIGDIELVCDGMEAVEGKCVESHDPGYDGGSGNGVKTGVIVAVVVVIVLVILLIGFAVYRCKRKRRPGQLEIGGLNVRESLRNGDHDDVEGLVDETTIDVM
jgi:hypothetical protein